MADGSHWKQIFVLPDDVGPGERGDVVVDLYPSNQGIVQSCTATYNIREAPVLW